MSLTGLGEAPEPQRLPALFPAPEPGAPTPGSTRRRSGSTPSGLAGPPDTDDTGRQLVFFGADAAEPAIADLAGLLSGPGEVVRMGGTARLSIQVDAGWRVHVLVAELATRGLAASWEQTEDERHAVRTSYTRVLQPLAVAWLHGSVKRPPATFHLTGRRLRLWLAAAGAPEPTGGYLLRLGEGDQECWGPIGAALAAAGLTGTLLGPGEGGPAYRITGRRRLGRLAELVGEPPRAAPANAWPARP